MKNVIYIIAVLFCITNWILMYDNKQKAKEINQLNKKVIDEFGDVDTYKIQLSEYQEAYYLFLKKNPDCAIDLSKIMDSINCSK